MSRSILSNSYNCRYSNQFIFKNRQTNELDYEILGGFLLLLIMWNRICTDIRKNKLFFLNP